jgi:hypothetical protein
MNIASEIISWLFPVVCIVLIVLAATRRRLRGKFWFITFAAGFLIIGLAWRIPSLLLRFNLIEVESFSDFYDSFGFIINIFELLIFSLLIPFILIAPVPKKLLESPGSFELPQGPFTDPSINPRLSGIGGWLIFPAIGLVTGTIISIVGVILFLSQAPDLLDEYGVTYIINLFFSVVMTLFILFAAIVFFAKKRFAPAIMISLLLSNIAVSGLLLLINISADAEIFAIEDAKGLVQGIIGSAIWVPYFCVSKRVKATFVK